MILLIKSLIKLKLMDLKTNLRFKPKAQSRITWREILKEFKLNLKPQKLSKEEPL